MGGGIGAYTPQYLVSCARVAAAAQEQMGLFENAARTWRALFAKAGGAYEDWPVTLMDRFSLVRVLARCGKLDTATRRACAATLIHLVRTAGMPADNYRRFTAILRRQVGLHFETVGDHLSAMQAYGKALRLAGRHPGLFGPREGRYRCHVQAFFSGCAAAIGAATWQGRPIDNYSSAFWQAEGH